MSKTVQKEFTVNEVLIINEYYNSEINRGEDSVLNRLSNLTRWNLKRNINEFKTTVDDFQQYNEKLSEDVRNEWFFNDEKSYKEEEVVKDEEGKDVLDNDGKPVTRELRKIKEEFIEEYDKAMDEHDKATIEVLSDVNRYNIKTSNVGDEIEEFIDDLSEEELRDISILLFMDNTEE